MGSDAPAIEVCGLEVRYGDTQALRGLDLQVPRGTFFGLLGPNGAGKTTTVGVLTTLLTPSAGSARLLGRDVVAEREQVRPDVGVVFQESTLDPELSAREHLMLYARLYRIAERRRRVDELLELVGLVERAREPTRRLSGGLKRRLEIARGLLHAPRVLFLDEPTLGLDVAARAAVWDHLRQLRARGETTLFVTTHSMDEADVLCERLAIVDRGRRVAEGSPEELKAALGGDVVRLALERDGAAAALEALEGVQRVRSEPAADGGPCLHITVADGPRRLVALIEAAREYGVREVSMQRPTLEHVFLHHTGHDFEPSEEAE